MTIQIKPLQQYFCMVPLRFIALFGFKGFSTGIYYWFCDTQFYIDDNTIILSFRSSVVFAASWYTIVFIFGMSSLLVHQLLFISFNLTGDEWRRSSRNKPFWEVLWRHRYNRGFLRNWIDFLFLQDVRSITEEVV